MRPGQRQATIGDNRRLFNEPQFMRSIEADEQTPGAEIRAEKMQRIYECLTEIMDKVLPIESMHLCTGFVAKLEARGVLSRIFDEVAYRAQLTNNDPVQMKLLLIMIEAQRIVPQPVFFCAEFVSIVLGRFCLLTEPSRFGRLDRNDIIRIRTIAKSLKVDASQWPLKQV